MKKLLSLLLIAVIILPCLSSCSVKYNSQNPETALTIEGREISYDLYRYFYMSYKTAEGNEDKSAEEIKQSALTSLKELVAIEKMAEKYDLELSDEALDLLKENMKQLRTVIYANEEEMIKELEKQYLSEQAYYDLCYHIDLEAVVSAYLCEEANMIIISSDRVVEQAIKDTFLAAINIVIYPDTTKGGLTGKELAESLRQRIIDGEDMEKLAEEYSDYASYKMPFFAPLTMQASFEERVKGLKIGELSEVYESELGFYITKRIEITDEYINKNFNSMRDEYIYSEYLKIMTELTNGLNVSFAEDFDISKVDY